MWPFLWLTALLGTAAVAGIAYLVKRSRDEDLAAHAETDTEIETEHAPIPAVILPAPSASEWEGWIWPVPIADGRTPVITQEWKPGNDPIPGQASSATANHLGVDIMYRKLASDPVGRVHHDASKAFIAPEGTKVLAAGPGKIWNVHHSDFYGTSVTVDHGDHPTLGGRVTFYQHLASLARDWKKGDPINAGDVIGDMGYAPGDREGLRHLHFELWFPRKDTSALTWRIDPAPYMKLWPKATIADSPMVAGVPVKHRRGTYR